MVTSKLLDCLDFLAVVIFFFTLMLVGEIFSSLLKTLFMWYAGDLGSPYLSFLDFVDIMRIS